MDDDWRLPGDSEVLLGAEFVHTDYAPESKSNDHDHCSFCWQKFMEGGNPLREADALAFGYAAVDRPPGRSGYYWVCDECFADFRERFQWTIVRTEG